MKKPDISVVVPLYACEKTIVELVERLKLTLENLVLTFEIILVNDGSPQNDWNKCLLLADKYFFVKAVNLSRNFGQHPAIFCGLELAKGEWIVVMDGDLQDVPEEIVKLYKSALQGNMITLAARQNREDNFFKKLNSFLFYKILNYFTGAKLSHQVGNFGIYHKKVVYAILSMGDAIKFLPTMINWVGYDKVIIPVKHNKRLVGSSSYSFFKLLSLAFDNIISFSNKPLKIVIKIGFGLVFISLLMVFYNIYLHLSDQIKVKGYSTIVISIWFLFGCMISILGVIGVYLGKVFDKVKNRPSYLIQEIRNS